MSNKMIKWGSSSNSNDKEYFMDVKAFMETREKTRKQGFEHPLHSHLLELREVFLDSTNKVVICHVCRLFIRGCAFYTCSLHCNFHLHEFCAHLPQTMTHLILDEDKCQHILKLTSIKASEIKDSKDHNKCNICDEKVFGHISISRPTNYRMICYKCSEDDCKFVVHFRCVASVFTVKDRGHRHVLVPRLYPPASFLCSICGEKNDDKESLFYICNECPFMVHDTCYPLPRKIQHPPHPHPLRLCLKKAIDFEFLVYDMKYYCGICNKLIFDKYWWYICPTCNYTIHVKCSLKESIEMVLPKLDEKEVTKLLFPNKKSVHQTLTQLVRKFCKTEEEEESSGDHNNLLLHHSNHDCSLVICEKIDNDNNQMCDACVLPICEPPFYACLRDSCNFFLHKWCANLPKELKITHHEYPDHTFVLVEKETDRLGFHTCRMCRKLGNGFFFQCRQCRDYYIDIKCASLPDFVKHYTHGHPLRLLKTNENLDILHATCYCCVGNLHFECAVYGCVCCHLFLHIKCLWVPQKMDHWYDDHPFSLVYNWPVAISGDGSDDYFCEFCEITINDNYCFYHCRECNQSTHISCIGRDLYPMLKFGKLYHVSNIHQHSLKCVMVPSKDSHWVTANRCSFCDDSHFFRYNNYPLLNGGGGEMIFECLICEFIHPECIDPSLDSGDRNAELDRMLQITRHKCEYVL